MSELTMRVKINEAFPNALADISSVSLKARCDRARYLMELGATLLATGIAPNSTISASASINDEQGDRQEDQQSNASKQDDSASISLIESLMPN